MALTSICLAISTKHPTIFPYPTTTTTVRHSVAKMTPITNYLLPPPSPSLPHGLKGGDRSPTSTVNAESRKLKTNLNASNLQYRVESIMGPLLTSRGGGCCWHIDHQENNGHGINGMAAKPQTHKGDLKFNQKMNLHG